MKNNNYRKNLSLLITGGLGTLLLGLLYIYRVFGPQESDVYSWGYLSFFTGLISLVITILTRNKDSRVVRLILGMVFVFAAIIQIPPIAAWYLFHGHLSLTDTPLQGAFRVHWGFSIPHIIILILSAIAAARLFRWEDRIEELQCFFMGVILVVLEVYVFMTLLKKLPYQGPLSIGLPIFAVLLAIIYSLAGYLIGKRFSRGKLLNNSILLGIGPFLVIFFLLFGLGWIDETNWFGVLLLLMCLAFPLMTAGVAKRVNRQLENK